MEGRQRNIWWLGARFGRFLAQMGPQRPPQGPQQSHMDALCSMRSRDTKLHCEEKEEEEEEKEKKEA